VGVWWYLCTGFYLEPSLDRTLSGVGISILSTLLGEGLVSLTGALVCLHAAPWVQLSVSAVKGWLHNTSDTVKLC